MKLAFYWATGCGGCEVATLNTGETLLRVAVANEIIFWPTAFDFKHSDLEALAEGGIDFCFFNGAVRNSEDEDLARFLRAKSQRMIALGSCACEGGIPGLANVADRRSLLARVYQGTPSTENPHRTLPRSTFQVSEGELTLPELYDTVRTLPQTVEADYYLPGCPPAGHQLSAVLDAIAEGQLPPPGAVIGASEKTVCEECERLKEEKRIRTFVRPYEIIPDPERCLLEQGIICCGPATRGGCGARCLQANMPCRGCYGPPPGVVDQGVKLLSALASVMEASGEEEVERTLDQIVDPLGTFYRFSLPSSLLRRRKVTKGG